MKYLFIFFSIFLYAHPINLTKMDFNLTNKVLHLRFVSYNIEKAYNIEYPSEDAIRADKKRIFDYTKKHLIFKNCHLLPKSLKVKNEIVIDEYFDVKCNEYDSFEIKFDMFIKEDNSQIGVLKIFNQKKEYVLNFNDQNQIAKVEVNKKVSFFSFVKLGIIHILEGIDHITFLLMLLLPAIFYNKTIKKAFKDILIIATAFSVSHSIALMLSAFNIFNPPPVLIEIFIAFTIFITAINNIFHFVSLKKEWIVAFLFGFIHGFAFSEALRGLEMSFKNFVKIVLGFNLGVEIGQVIVILSVMPFLFVAIKKVNKIYYILSFLGALLGILWMIDRIFELNYMPF